jgi:hypothetical protein
MIPSISLWMHYLEYCTSCKELLHEEQASYSYELFAGMESILAKFDEMRDRTVVKLLYLFSLPC